MKKIFIFGLAGSGKTTLAKKLSEKLKIKSYDLDDIFFKNNNYKKRSEQDKKKILSKIIKNKKYILEGAHTDDWTSSMLKKVDTIIILKTKISLCKIRVLKRYIQRKLSKNTRKESLIGVLNLIAKFVNKKTLEESINQIEKYKGNNKPKIIIIKNKKEITKFINNLR